MNIIADLHMHTMVSNHAFNTVTEMARRACELGMFAAALTDAASNGKTKFLPKIRGADTIKNLKKDLNGVPVVVGFIFGNWGFLGAALAFYFITDRYTIVQEEKILSERFPQAWRQYCRHVRRWI